MKKWFILLILTAAFLCSCSQKYDLDFVDSDEIPYVENTSGKKYVVSVKGNTYHLEDCYIVKNMNEENIRFFYSKKDLEDKGNTPCKRCNP